MKKFNKYFVIMLSLLTIIVIFLIYNVSSSIISPDIKEVKNISIKKITNSNIELTVKILAENSSLIGYDINKMSLEVIHNNDTIGTIKKDTTISFPSRSQTEFELPIILYTEKVAKLLEKEIDTIKLNMIGNASIKLLFLDFDKKINIPFNLPLKKSIFNTVQEDTNKEKIIEIKDAKISKLGLRKSQLLIDFKLSNPYDIDFTLLDYPSEVYINGNYSGQGSLAHPITVDSINKVNDGTFVFDLDNFETISSIIGSILTRKIEYTTNGFLEMKILNHNVKIPYSFNGVIE
ncbi:MAG: LEA type 2 family protein [Ignavibacterium sp.]|nr:LEA type 2 family protein [Ignavibacterium sp.]